jgi:hypothetical protein
MSHVLAVAFLALIAWSSIGCESISALTEIEPMAQRVGALESQVEGKADRRQVEQLADVAQRAGEGALRAGDLAQGVERRIAKVEAAGLRSESELRAEISALKKGIQSQTAALRALEERLAVVQQVNRERRAPARAAGPSWPPPSAGSRKAQDAESRKAQDKLRTEGVLTQVKADVAALAGIGAGQLDVVDLAGFLPGSADISPVMEADQRARAQIEALKRMLAEGRAEVIQIASFDDKLPCRQAAHDCRTVGLRRGLNTASFLGAPKGAVDARAPTDRWGSPAENRRVVVFYVRKNGAQLAPSPGAGRPTTPAAAPSIPPAATTPTTARPR